MMPMKDVSQETVVKLGRCCLFEVSWTTEARVEMPSIYTPHKTRRTLAGATTESESRWRKDKDWEWRQVAKDEEHKIVGDYL